MTTAMPVDLGPFEHPALFYADRQDYLDGLVPFITEALDAQYPVLVAVPEPNLTCLGDALGGSAARVKMADMSEAGRNPGRILGSVLNRFARVHAGRPVRIIGEPIWRSRSELEYPACVQHEALINNAFAGRDAVIVCPYDTSSLADAVIEDAHATHPVVWQAGGEQASARFAPENVRERYNRPLEAGPAAATFTVNDVDELTDVRAFAAVYAQWFDVSPDTSANFELIASELASSSLEQGDGPCHLAFWRHEGHLVCEARDHTHLDDPLSGRRPYDEETLRGRALFVVNAVADLVRCHSAPGGTTIHAFVRIGGAA